MMSAIHGREANPSAVVFILIKSLLSMIVFWALFLFIIPSVIIEWERSFLISSVSGSALLRSGLGIVLFVLGGSLGLFSVWPMAFTGRGTPLPCACALRLVRTGPYRTIRNPMVIAGISQGIAVGVFTGSPSVVVYSLAGAIVWQCWIRPWEEADLSRRFGAEYARYQREVDCWWPRSSTQRYVQRPTAVIHEPVLPTCRGRQSGDNLASGGRRNARR